MVSPASSPLGNTSAWVSSRVGVGVGLSLAETGIAGRVRAAAEVRYDGRCCADDAKHGNSSDRRTDPGAALASAAAGDAAGDEVVDVGAQVVGGTSQEEVDAVVREQS